MRMRLLLMAALAATGLTTVAPSTVEAQATDNVLRVARGATSRDISVFINRAIVLESAQRFAEVSVANPGIADVAALSDQTIYILGKANGVTTLTLLGEGGKLIGHVGGGEESLEVDLGALSDAFELIVAVFVPLFVDAQTSSAGIDHLRPFAGAATVCEIALHRFKAHLYETLNSLAERFSLAASQLSWAAAYIDGLKLKRW